MQALFVQCNINDMKAFHFDAQPLHLPAGHRFPHEKYRALRERLASLPGLALHPAPAATWPQVAAVHDGGYIERVRSGGLTAAEQREIGFPWNPGMPVRAVHSVGATLAATQSALAEGVAINLGGGTHHAKADGGGGYCVFNDVAVAARWAQSEAGIQRVLVIDLDVHQGNGTAAIFAGDASVFTLSLHGEKNFPFRKTASDLDVDLPDDCGDEPYLAALDSALAQVAQRFARPELAFYLAGADPHEGDRLGRLRLSSAAMAARDQRVFDWLWARRVPAVMLMAGGYPTDLAAMLDVQQASVQAALQAWAQWKNAPNLLETS
jgi:acetoin utilization deacetylase AcuC-like enzyme